MAREWVFSTRPRAPGVQGIRNPSANFNQSGQRDSQRPAGAPAGPVTEHSDVTPARSAGLTASSEARKRAKGFAAPRRGARRPGHGAQRRDTGAQRRIDRFERSEKAGKGIRTLDIQLGNRVPTAENRSAALQTLTDCTE
jgi:hypothetical protein